MAVGVVADRATVKTALERFEAAAADLASLSMDALSPVDVLAVLDRVQAVTRASATLDHRLISRLATECDPRELGAKNMTEVLARRLRVSRVEAKRRLGDAEALGPRTAMSGEALEPVLPSVAAGVAEGLIGAEQVRDIREFFRKVPSSVDRETRDEAERELARHACRLGPDQFRKVAAHMLCLLDQDGTLAEGDRARRRGLTLGPQGFDGMSRLVGWVDPQLRATIEPIIAKYAAPGMCNPADQHPAVDDAPSPEQVSSDLRSPEQRRHDALLAGLRVALCSQRLGAHRGLPVSIIVSTTLQELQRGAGFGVTGGGSVVPMADLIRMASHAWHYLAVFDDHSELPLYLGRKRRLASNGQRIILHARDRGCTCPGCDVPGYYTDVHHGQRDWLDGGNTNIDELTFACPGDHRTLGPGEHQWTTRITNGRCEWIPPPHLDTGTTRTNDYHHPERLLQNKDGGQPTEPATPGCAPPPDHKYP